MKNILILLLLAISTQLWSYVFINSSPMNAKVYLDEEYIGDSPVLIKEEITGEHIIRYSKPDYFDFITKVDINSDLTNLYTFLSPRTFSLTFPNQHSVFIEEQQYDVDTIYSMPDGFYNFQTGTNYIKVQRINPNRRYLYTSIALAGIGIANTIIGKIKADSAMVKYQNATTPAELIEYMNETTFWDNYSYIGVATAGIGLGASLYFSIDAIRFNAKNEALLIKTVNESNNESDLYADALDLAGSEDYTGALEIYENIIQNYEDSKYKPLSLYRRAQIYSQLEQYDEAIQDMNLILDEYPLYDIYGLTLKSLGDIYFQMGEYLLAISQYEELADINPSYQDTMQELIIEAYTALLDTAETQEEVDEITQEAQEYMDITDYTDIFPLSYE